MESNRQPNSLNGEPQYKSFPENLEPIVVLPDPRTSHQIQIEMQNQPNNAMDHVQNFNSVNSYMSRSEFRSRNINEDDINHEKFTLQQTTVQEIPWKIYIIVAGFLVGGSIFFIWGFVDLFAIGYFSEGLGFSILGGLMLITGIFYSLKIYAFQNATSPEDRQRVLNDIPLD